MLVIKIFKVLGNCHEGNKLVSEEKDLGIFLSWKLFWKEFMNKSSRTHLLK